ncbi:MAG: leucine-rich repeat domain-containing protein [Treponema sp.]|nr:leucine-rich repeat domain-containing protein [Treponema sp.]
MLKRKILAFISAILIFSSFPLLGQESDDVFGEISTRYQFIQQFKWMPSAKAAQYEVVIESFEDGKWVPEIESVKTKKTSIQLSLYPGQKRIQIISLNKLGRRGKKTEWAEFLVLDETQPYLYADYLKKSRQWDSPLLQVTRGEGDVVEENVESEKGDPENSFFLKGKNIFLTETKFYMEPVDESSSGGRLFEAFNKRRKTVPLKLVRNDFEREGVVVAYNSEDLYSGYYQIVAENPGNQKAYLDILVLADRPPEFDEKQFDYFPNYEVRILDVSKIKDNEGILYVKGAGFTGDTRFTLAPSTSGIPYPFSSSKERAKLDLYASSINPLNESGDMELAFKVNPENVPPGYYYLNAENSMGKSTVFLLVRDIEREAGVPKIDSIATQKSDKEKISLLLKGENLTSECVFTLVSPMSEYTGLSTRVPMIISESNKNGKKIVIEGSKSAVEPGVYALMAESPENSVVKYIEFGKKDKAKKTQLSLAEETNIFIRPEGFVPREDGEEEILSDVKELEYIPYEFTALKKYRVFLPYVEFDYNYGPNYFAMGLEAPDSTMSAGINFELLNLNVLHWGFAGSYDWQQQIANAETYLRLSTAGINFRPYMSFGAGANLFGLDLESPLGIYAFTNVGLCLGNFLDVRYTLHFSGIDRLAGLEYSTYGNPLTGNYFYDDVTVGVRIPLGKFKYKLKPVNQQLTITKKGVVSGDEYKLRKDIKRIVFADGITEIKNFNDNYMLTSVSIPDSVRVIGKDAFKNCINLKEVILPDGVEEIQEGAFEGCRGMQKIVLPTSIRKISAQAFTDWKDYQFVVYSWTKDDTTFRDLGGLYGKPNFTTIYDARRTPFEQLGIFGAFQQKNAKAYTSSKWQKIDGIEYAVTEFNSTITSSTNDIGAGFSTGDPKVFDYLMNGDGITFKYIGDGHIYSIVFISSDQKTRFYYKFTAKEGINTLTVPYKFFIYDEWYSKRYVKLKKMVPLSFGIENDYDTSYKGKRTRLVVYGIETIMEKK